MPAAAVREMTYRTPEVPPITLRVLAKPFRVPATSLSGRLLAMSDLIASAPLFRVEPQSPSPTLRGTHAMPIF